MTIMNRRNGYNIKKPLSVLIWASDCYFKANLNLFYFPHEKGPHQDFQGIPLEMQRREIHFAFNIGKIEYAN